MRSMFPLTSSLCASLNILCYGGLNIRSEIGVHSEEIDLKPKMQQ